MAGLRDILALQGVVPVSAAPVTSTAGATLGLYTGNWVDGAPAATTTPGADLGLYTGTWVGGAPAAVPGDDGGFISWLQLTGVWINGSAGGDAPVEEIGDGGHYKGHGAVIQHRPGSESHPKLTQREVRKYVALALLAIDEYYR